MGYKRSKRVLIMMAAVLLLSMFLRYCDVMKYILPGLTHEFVGSGVSASRLAALLRLGVETLMFTTSLMTLIPLLRIGTSNKPPLLPVTLIAVSTTMLALLWSWWAIFEICRPMNPTPQSSWQFGLAEVFFSVAGCVAAALVWTTIASVLLPLEKRKRYSAGTRILLGIQFVGITTLVVSVILIYKIVGSNMSGA